MQITSVLKDRIRQDVVAVPYGFKGEFMRCWGKVLGKSISSIYRYRRGQ